MADSIVFPVRDCTCPDAPHDKDTVTFPPRLSIEAGIATMAAIQQSAGDPVVLEAKLGRALFLYGPSDWNLVDRRGEPRPFVRSLLEDEFPWASGGFLIAEKANELYAEEAMAPLLARMAALSPPGPTDDSASPIPLTRSGHPKSSRRSSASAAS